MRDIVKVAENSLYIANLRMFLDYEPQIPEDWDGKIPDKVRSVEFRNVSFAYKDGQYALKNVSFTAKTGQQIALVGHNGSGKTTLIKLLLRLYDPTEGEILLNGINLREYNLKALRSLFGVVFQDFQVFSMTAVENVAMSGELSSEQRESCIKAMEECGILEKFEELPKGADTVLTREFDSEGTNLSKGETQKLAVARALVREAPILLLDEPSSALDPVAEHEMLGLLSKTYSTRDDKLVFLISHRMSAVIDTHNILVLENGEIIQSGTHDKLLSQDGTYNEMFTKQAGKYYA
jgi:ATP-binding cassette subfamily B protein